MPMGGTLYRLTCSVDSVLAAESAEDAMAYAGEQRHEVQVEALERPEALVGLDSDEAVIVLAALHRVRDLNGAAGHGAAVGVLIDRLEDAIGLIERQSSLRLHDVTGA